MAMAMGYSRECLSGMHLLWGNGGLYNQSNPRDMKLLSNLASRPDPYNPYDQLPDSRSAYV
jgi:hypothetical protein